MSEQKKDIHNKSGKPGKTKPQVVWLQGVGQDHENSNWRYK